MAQIPTTTIDQLISIGKRLKDIRSEIANITIPTGADDVRDQLEYVGDIIVDAVEGVEEAVEECKDINDDHDEDEG